MKIISTARGATAVALAGALAAAVGVLAAGVTGAAPGAAPVAPIDPVAGGQGFDVIVEGDARVSGNENEGTMALGGNLTLGGGYRVGDQGAGGYTFPGDARPTALVVGGQVDFAGGVSSGTVQVLSNMYAKVGDLTNAAALDVDRNGAQVDTHVVARGTGYDATPRVELTTRQPASSVGTATGPDFTALFADFRRRSADLAACAGTVTLLDGNGQPLADQSSVPAGSGVQIRLTEGVTNVLKITGANLANISSLTVLGSPLPSASTPLLIDVDTGAIGGTYSFAPPTGTLSGAHAPYVLWNFATATAITMPAGRGDSLVGTLYAPSATLLDENSAHIEGSVVLAGLTHGTGTADGGEIHHFPFAATLDCGAAPSPTPTTPTPTTPTPTPPRRGNLSVDKTADRIHADIGQIITFTLTAANATNATIRTSLTDDLGDALSQGDLVGRPRADTGMVGYTSPVLTWAGELDPAETVTITYMIRATRGGEIRNTVVWPGGTDCLEVWVWDRHHDHRPHHGGPHHGGPHWHHHHDRPHHEGRPCPWHGPGHGGHGHGHKKHGRPARGTGG